MSDYDLQDKKDVRLFFNKVRQAFLDWNGTAESDKSYSVRKAELITLYSEKKRG